MKLIIITALIGILCALSAVLVVREIRLSASREEAAKFLSDGVASLWALKYADAVPLLLHATQLDPKNAEAWLRLGDAYSHLKSDDKAASAFLEALRLKSGLTEARIRLAQAYRSLGQATLAEKEMTEALKNSPDYAEKHGRLGRDAAAKGNWREASAALYEVVLAEPDNTSALREYAMASVQSGDVLQAQSALVHAISLAPDDATLHYSLGRISVSNVRSPLRQAIALKPDYADAYVFLAWASRPVQNPYLDPPTARPKTESQPGYKPLAGSAAQSESLSDSTGVDGRAVTAASLIAQDNWADATPQLEALSRLQDERPETHMILASAYLVTGEDAKSLAEHGRAIELNPHYALAHYSLARLHLLKGDPSAAFREYGILKGLDAGLATDLFRRLSANM